MAHPRTGLSTRTRRLLGSWLATLLLVGTQIAAPVAQAAPAPTAPEAAAAPSAPTNTIALHVFAARSEPDADIGPVTKGDAVTAYTWMINEDNTGTNTARNADPGSGCSPEDPDYADPDPATNSCTWTSIAGLRSSAPVVAQGDASDFEAGGRFENGIDLADGKYLVSVLANGYKLDGTHFTIPHDPGTIDVPLQPLPLPTATATAQVFADVTSANGQYDPGEDGLPGFTGKLADYLGQVNTDVFGNPLCTTYVAGNGPNGYEWFEGGPVVDHLGGKCLSGDANMDGVVNATYNPTTNTWSGADGVLYTDPALGPGVLRIPNLGPNRYAMMAVPPTGQSWVQTTTLEGNHDWDTWLMEGATGYDTEFVVAGEPFPFTIFGYVPGPDSTYRPPLTPAGDTHAKFWNLDAHSFATGGPTGTITGVIDAMKVYVPATGGNCLPGTIWGGLCGGKVDGPITDGWIALSDLGRGDTAVKLVRAEADGTFQITGVPVGTYTLTYWDEKQNYILDLVQVTVAAGGTEDLGVLPLTGWFTKIDGYVFNDENRNGKMDGAEKGVPNFGLTLRKRENSLMDRGSTAVSTDTNGYYIFENAYPLTEWVVLEAYNDSFYTTGVTYQADNQPEPTTILGAGVDVSVLPIIGLAGRIDWGVHNYDPTGEGGVDPQNGGIVGSISYDTTRNELDPQYAAAEDWQPGVSGITVELHATVDCGTNPGTPCDARGDYELAPDGSLAKGKLLNTYVSETWERPTSGPDDGQLDCIARDVDGKPLAYPTDQQVLPVGPNKGCLEGPLMGVQFGTYAADQGTADASFGAAVDGNYGFGDACLDGTLDATDPAAPVCKDSNGVEIPFTPLDAGAYLVGIDLAGKTDSAGAPIYKVTREEDINIGNGDTFVPQVPPPSCAGPLHTVDVATLGDDGYGAVAFPSATSDTGTATGGDASTLVDTTKSWQQDQWIGARLTITTGTGSGQVRAVTASDATSLTVADWDTVPDTTSVYELAFDFQVQVPGSTPTDNQTFVDIGGSPYEGRARPLCDTKLVDLQNGKSIVPMFNVFTDVPLPGRFFFYNVDDLNFSTDPKSLLYGEKAGMAFNPVGVYDWANRLVTTVETDYNGLADVLLPSTNRINCPTPSGVCANLYRFVGNDPGVPGRLNENYNPQYRTIAAEFEALPGLIVPADTAPTQVGINAQLPGAQFNGPLVCRLNDPAPAVATTPELFAVSKPYADMRTAGLKTFSIDGRGFGGAAGIVALDGVPMTTANWSDTHIDVTVPAATAVGPHQLSITSTTGARTVNGLTFHLLGYAPFPATGILDNFNRTGFGGDWNAPSPPFSLSSATGGGTSTYSVRVTGTGTMRWGGSAGGGPVYGPAQEAAFTFVEVSPTGTEQGLFLKVTGSGNNPNPTDTSAAYIEVSYKATAPTGIQVRTKANGTNTVELRTAAPIAATFAANDRLGARALPDGTVIAYKNGVEVGRVTIPTTGAGSWPNGTGGGRLGVRFVGAQNNTTNDARFDDFGGGNVASYIPNLYEVGPGLTGTNQFEALQYDEGNPPHPIQDALDAAAASAGDDLVVVYPGLDTPNNPRLNPRGAYYENLIVHSPVKLQGVGPGGIDAAGNLVPGSVIDGSAFGGDTALAETWRVAVDALTRAGNQTVYEGPTITVFAETTGQYRSAFRAGIDGFDVRGGDQSNFPQNINEIGGTPTGLPPNVVTQGGGIYVNAYARYLQVTNNVVESNSGSYAGGIRIGTPNLAQPDTSQHNENIRIANNRVVTNGGTNLAGGIGLFAGSDGYVVSGNDICGNSSAEYGGGVSVYGYSPFGSIDHNRIWFNASYDEGAGIMIAGELPADPSILSPGTGPVDIHDNVVQDNIANDDGGGIRFLMAGNFPMNVYNNMIVNNVSTHEGGGIAIDDAPDVRVFSNTIMKNLTTATAVTSTGAPAPAGLSTGANSAALQATLPGGSPTFSNPLLFNNIFWDNRAGTRTPASSTVTGIGLAGATDVDNWDLGVGDGSGTLAPTNSIVQQSAGDHAYTASPTNSAADPAVVEEFATSVSFAPWRTNPNFVGALLVAVDAPAGTLGDYHIGGSSPAINLGAASKGGVNAPAWDIDNNGRPNGAGQDAGADEIAGATAPTPSPAPLAFPQAGVLDSFNRTNGGLGGSWAGSTNQANFRIDGNEVQVRSPGDVQWNATGSTFGASQEAFLTFTKVAGAAATKQGLILKRTGNGSSLIEVVYNPATGRVNVQTAAGGTLTSRASFPAVFYAGDQLGARALADGTIAAFRNGVQLGSVSVPAATWPGAAGGGQVGVRYAGTSNANDARFDDFGGGTLP